MADISYESLQSQIEEQKGKIATQREFIGQERIVGQRSIESLRRVHPRIKPGVYFGQVAPRIESIKGRLIELKTAEKELGVAEQKLSEQETLLAKRKAEGYKIRRTDGEFEFYKEIPAVAVGAPRGDFSVRVRWGIPDPNTGEIKEENIKTVLGRASKLESMQQQIADRGGIVLEVESLGGGRYLRTPEMRTTTGGSFLLYEAKPEVIKPVIEKEITVPPLVITDDKIKEYVSKMTPPPEAYTPVYQPPYGKPPGVTGTLRELTGYGEVDISTIAPTPVSIATTKAGLRIKREGIEGSEAIQKIFKQELRKQGHDIIIIEGETFVVKGTAESYKQRLKKIETTKVEIKRLMTGSPIERVAGMGLWISTGLLSWEDPFGIVSGYQALRGEPEKALETKARAVVGLPIGEPWSPERFAFLGKAFTGPVAMVGITYGISAGLGAGVGAFEATTVGKYPLLVSKGVKVVAGVAKPLWTLTPAKAIEIGIGGYFGVEAVRRTIPVIEEARRTGEYAPLAGYLGSLGIYGYVGIKGYKLGKVFGYGRAEEYLYLRETYAPGTREYIRFKAALKVARELEPIKPRDISTLDLAKDIQKLTPEGVQALYGALIAKKRVITIAGSAATYPQVRGARPPRDIDLLVSGWRRNLGFVRAKLKGEYGIDIHGKEFGYPGQYRRFGFLYQARQKITILGPKGEILGIKALRASEQLFRKGITSVLKEERLRHGILPGYDFPLKGTRPILKDIYDFVTIARSLITDAYKGRGIFIKGRAIRAERALEIFLHPEKAPSFIKGMLPAKPKPFFWKRAVVTPELLSDILLFKGKVYPRAYPIGVGLGYAPSIIPTKIPSYVPSAKIEIPPYVVSYKPSDYIPPYVPTKAPPYIPTYEPPYVPTKAPPYIPTYEPPYVPTKAPPYIPTYEPPYVPTKAPPYAPPYEPPYVPGYVPTVTPPPKPPKKILIPKTTYEMFGHTMGQGYHVYVKERHYFKGKKVKEGKMVRLSKRPLSRMDALSLGGMAVDNSAAATFEIKPVNAMAQEPLIKLKSFDEFQDKFYMKDSKYIEKTTHRIDTRGEVQGISALGWYAERTKKAAKKREVVARRPRERVVKERVVRERDMFDTGMDDMLINMNKLFKGVFNFGF